MTGYVVSDMRKLGHRVVAPVLYDTATEWVRTIKSTIARFTRGNIAAQNERILLKEEQAQEHASALKIAQRWRNRQRHAA